MLREIKEKKTEEIKKSINIYNKLRYEYLKNPIFQDLWFSIAPGSGKDESERDFQIISYIYEHITKNKTEVKEMFESSPYFKSKDAKHINKWNYDNYRYFDYIWSHL